MPPCDYRELEAKRSQIVRGYLSPNDLLDECLNGERFDTLLEAQVLIEMWRNEYNQVRPHSSLGYRPPAPEVGVGVPVLSAKTLTLQVV